MEITKVCLHCKGSHKTFDKNCTHYQHNKKINEIIAYESKKAKTQIKQETQASKKLAPKEEISPGVLINLTNFPQLKKLSMSEEFKIKRIGGHPKMDNNPTH
ncbi:unnamed protein product [Heterotrigona itama]|uniref:Uncharacterized protein n=1 Tax=Heterotrigona itama TaxID=395501 RepID=A0A6V7HIN3_9HYME|nr:unnamed protein product [Heterotrigona itama]